MRRGQTGTGTACIAAAFTAAAGMSAAQEAPGGGLILTFGVGLGVSVTDNEALADPSEGATTLLDTDFTFGLISETRTTSLEAAVGFGAEYRDEPGSDGAFDVTSPTGSIRYERLGANSVFSAGARLTRDRLDETVLTFLDEDLNPVDLVFDAGSLQRLRADASLVFGIEGPFGATLSTSVDDRDYIDTADPELYDRRTLTASAGVRLQFSEVATGRASIGITQFDADDALQTERTTYVLGAGVDYAVSPVTTVSVDANYTQIEESLLGIALDPVDAVGFSVGAVRDLPNGTITGTLSRDVNTDGTTRNLVSFGRALALPRGSLSFGAGYSFSDTGEDSFLANLDVVRDLPDGSLRASLAQTVAQNDDEEDTLVSRLSLGYTRDINSVSDIRFGLGLGRTEDLSGANAGITTRANLEVVYTRDFVADLDWSVGYRARYIDEPGTSSRVSNSVFTRIDRSFSIRP